MNKQEYDTLCAAADQSKSGNPAPARQCEVVDRKQWIADLTSIGVMELALTRISEDRMPKVGMVTEARRALKLFHKYQEEAKQQ